MRLRKKTLVVIGVISLLLAIGLYLASMAILLNSYRDLEEKDVKENVNRTLDALKEDICSLSSTNSDWSKWDDTFNFVTGNYNEYIEENIDYNTLINLDINLVIFTNSSGQVIFGALYNLENEEEQPVPQSLLDLIYQGSYLVNHSDVYDAISGIINLMEGSILISSQPILNNDWVLPIGGTLIFGRFIEALKLESLSERVHLSITTNNYDDPQMASDFQNAKSKLSADKLIAVQILNDKSVAGYALIEDIYGNPALILKAEMPRDIYNQGVITLNLFIIFSAILGIIYIVLMIYFLDSQILSRLSRLSNDVNGIIKGEKKCAKVTVAGNDEISSLGIEINKMLSSQELRKKKLESSNKELEQFAYVVSHDLQEPLRMVDSYLSLIKRRYEGKLDDEADEFIEFAADGARRMKAMINDLLIYSRVETRGNSFKPTDINAIIENTKKNLKVAIEEKNGIIKSEHLPTVMADESQMIQLFQNLINNAIKYHGKEQPNVTISAKNLSNEWLFSVKDNGIGIDPKHSERIFQIFQRLHTREEYPGTGIGLAVSKKIVERHGGRIWVESEPGMGSTFYFTIPNNGGVRP